jgi:hypothetical protein
MDSFECVSERMIDVHQKAWPHLFVHSGVHLHQLLLSVLLIQFKDFAELA